MDYYNTHLRKTSDPIPVTLSKLERGMVLKIKYKKDTQTKMYLVFVLQPKWPNSADGKLHGLSLKEIPLNKFQEFAEVYEEVMATSAKVKRLDIAKLRIDEASKMFYTKEIRTDKKLKVGYRTFTLKNIKSMFAVNYDWGKFDRIASEAERKQRAIEAELDRKAREETMDDRID